MASSAPLTVAPGRAVCVQYRLSLEGGVTLEAPKAPQWYVQGGEGFPTPLQKALVGQAKGAVIAVRLEAKEAFGLRDDALVVTMPRARFTGALQVGDRVEGTEPGMAGKVRALDETSVTVDFNPEFAGAPIIARLEVVEVAAELPPQIG